MIFVLLDHSSYINVSECLDGCTLHCSAPQYTAGHPHLLEDGLMLLLMRWLTTHPAEPPPEHLLLLLLLLICHRECHSVTLSGSMTPFGINYETVRNH